MMNETRDIVFITQEACSYLRISRPTYVKYIIMGKIKGIKAGKGWRVLKSELDRFLEDDFLHRRIVVTPLCSKN